MSIGDGGGVQGPQNQTFEAMQSIKEDTSKELKSEQKAADKSAQASNTQTVFRPKKRSKTKKTLKTVGQKISKLLQSKKEKRLLPTKLVKQKAQEHEKKNPELKSRVLQLLREKVKPDSSAEDIQEVLDEFYPDPMLADDAMEFLLDTSEGELHQQVQEAKDNLNESKGREIVAGRNISTQARQASEKGLGTPTGLRDMYRDVTGNPRDSNTMFQELSDKYSFKEMHKVVKFLLHSLGSDLKSKGPSIPKGELHRLMSETRSLQAILGVYRFYKGRMGLMQKMFKKAGLNMPKKLGFETMAKAFMTLAGERYPSSDKVLSQAKRLGVDDWIHAKIIAFTQMRDSIREMAMSQIFRSLQHRDELLMALIEALEDLEDELEDLLDRQEEEEGEDWEEEEEE